MKDKSELKDEFFLVKVYFKFIVCFQASLLSEYVLTCKENGMFVSIYFSTSHPICISLPQWKLATLR